MKMSIFKGQKLKDMSGVSTADKFLYNMHRCLKSVVVNKAS